MKRNDTSTTKSVLKIALGLTAVFIAVSMRGAVPELLRYLRIRRM